MMTLFQKLFSRKPQPKQRVRVCIECGMPLAEHKEWCSILRYQQEMERKAQDKGEVRLTASANSSASPP